MFIKTTNLSCPLTSICALDLKLLDFFLACLISGTCQGGPLAFGTLGIVRTRLTDQLPTACGLLWLCCEVFAMCTQETFWWVLRIDVRIALEFWLLHVYRVCVIHGGMGSILCEQ